MPKCVRACICACVRACLRAHVRVCVRACVRACVRECASARVPFMRARVCVCAYVHAYLRPRRHMPQQDEIDWYLDRMWTQHHADRIMHACMYTSVLCTYRGFAALQDMAALMAFIDPTHDAAHVA